MQFTSPNQSLTPSSKRVLCLITVFVGIISGLAATFLELLLHTIQHLAYGYDLRSIFNDEHFITGVSHSSPLRRVIVMTMCGLIAGIGWWCVNNLGKPLVSISTAVRADKPSMPVPTTLLHILLQIVTVALGSPLGREVAPRELSVLFTGWLMTKTKLTQKETQIMLACAAGAGLAAVYNVPFSGALFTLEVLLCTFGWSALLPAFTTAIIATIISWVGLNNTHAFFVTSYTVGPSLILWSILVGPLFGYLAFWFARIASIASKKTAHNWQTIMLCVLNFIMIGVLAIYFPAILGNGKSPVQLELSNAASFTLTVSLLIIRTLIVWSSLRSGARGGLLTPSLANGALLAVVLGGLWNLYCPANPFSSYAVIGAVAFLAASQRMPITAIIFVFECTQLSSNYVVPILCAVIGAVGVRYLCDLNKAN